MAGLVVLVLIPNLAAAWATVSNIVTDGYAYDWVTFTRAAERLSSGDMYDFGGSFGFRWSPVAAWLLVVITPMGLTAWRLAHIAALALLHDWRIIAVALLSYPFWFDVETGNINTFVLVAAISAIRGSKLGTGIYLLLFLLVPRPLAFPVAIWLLWQRPQWRWPFVIAAAAHLVAVWLTGLSGAWVLSFYHGASELSGDLNLGPSRFIGAWWVLIGLPLSAWLTARGRLGLASLAASPYWLPYYFLMLLLGFVRRSVGGQRRTQIAASSSS